MAVSSKFYKNNETDKIWWVYDPDDIGTLRFSFDRKTIYFLYQDYGKLTPEQRAVFDKENPEWAALFKAS